MTVVKAGRQAYAAGQSQRTRRGGGGSDDGARVLLAFQKVEGAGRGLLADLVGGRASESGGGSGSTSTREEDYGHAGALALLAVIIRARGNHPASQITPSRGAAQHAHWWLGQDTLLAPSSAPLPTNPHPPCSPTPTGQH